MINNLTALALDALSEQQQAKVNELVERHFAARLDGYYLSTYRLCARCPELRQLVKQAVRKIHNRQKAEKWIKDVLAEAD